MFANVFDRKPRHILEHLGALLRLLWIISQGDLRARINLDQKGGGCSQIIRHGEQEAHNCAFQTGLFIQFSQDGLFRFFSGKQSTTRQYPGGRSLTPTMLHQENFCSLRSHNSSCGTWSLRRRHYPPSSRLHSLIALLPFSLLGGRFLQLEISLPCFSQLGNALPLCETSLLSRPRLCSRENEESPPHHHIPAEGYDHHDALKETVHL